MLPDTDLLTKKKYLPLAEPADSGCLNVVLHFMQKLPRTIAAIFTGLLFTVVISCGDKIKFGQWTVQNSSTDNANLSWAKFTWANEILGGKSFKRTAMLIPLKIEGLPYDFLFQFDLGSNLTVLEGNPLKTILEKHPEFDRMHRQVAFKDLTLFLGETKMTSRYCSVMPNQGAPLAASSLTDNLPIRLGTIGADIFQNKILVIDYPNQRFAVCDTLSGSFQATLTKITLDELGRVLLPLRLNEKNYKVMFDNGASLFPLIMSDDKINDFSTAASTDTITTSSWGTIHNVIGRPLKQEFQLAGQTFSNIIVYADYRQDSRADTYDASAGNALFWNKTIVIDFKNQRFGVK